MKLLFAINFLLLLYTGFFFLIIMLNIPVFLFLDSLLNTQRYRRTWFSLFLSYLWLHFQCIYLSFKTFSINHRIWNRLHYNKHRYFIGYKGYSLAIAPVYEPLDWVSFMSYIWIIACLLIILVIHRLANLIWLNYKKQKIEALRINSD
jgi:hypothetical protein